MRYATGLNRALGVRWRPAAGKTRERKASWCFAGGHRRASAPRGAARQGVTDRHRTPPSSAGERKLCPRLDGGAPNPIDLTRSRTASLTRSGAVSQTAQRHAVNGPVRVVGARDR